MPLTTDFGGGAFNPVPIGYYETPQERFRRLEEQAARLAAERGRKKQLEEQQRQLADEHFREVQQEQAVQAQRRRIEPQPEATPTPPPGYRLRQQIQDVAQNVSPFPSQPQPSLLKRAASAVGDVAGAAGSAYNAISSPFTKRVAQMGGYGTSGDIGEAINYPRSRLVQPALEQVVPESGLKLPGRLGQMVPGANVVETPKIVGAPEALSYILDPQNLVFFGGEAGRVAQLARKVMRGEKLLATEAPILETAIQRAETDIAAKAAGEVPKPVNAPTEGTKFHAAGELTPEAAKTTTAAEEAQTGIGKLVQAINNAAAVRPEQRVMFGVERGKRLGKAVGALEQGVAEGKGMKAFTEARQVGRFEHPKFDIAGITDADVNGWANEIAQSKFDYYTKDHAAEALRDLSSGHVPQPQHMEDLVKIFPEAGGLTEALSRKGPLSSRLVNEAVAVLGLPLKMKTIWDFGTRVRQSAVLGWSNPKEWLSVWKPMKDSFFSEKAAEQIMRDAKSDIPWSSFIEGEKTGLGWEDLKGHDYKWDKYTSGGERVPGFTGMNYSFVNQATDRIPGVLGSQRSFAVDLNLMGRQVYAKEAQAMWDIGVRDPQMYKDVVDVINHARGYGAFNPGTIGKGVNAFFSGRNLVARFQVLLDPFVKSGSLFQPSARQLAAKNLAGMIAGDMSLLGLVGAVGAATGIASVEFNPLKPGADWLKIKIGNQRIDPWGGFQPLARLITHMAAASVTETGVADTGYSMGDVKKELGIFFSNKESPVVRLFTDAAGVSEAFGSGALSLTRVVDLFTPFVAQDVYEAVKNSDWGPSLVAKAGAGALAGATSFVGAGVQTYQPSDYAKFTDAFKTQTGEDYTGLTRQKDLINSDPNLKTLFDQSNIAAQERGTPGAQARQTLQDQFIVPEEAKLLPTAQQALSGNPDSLSNWSKVRGDFLAARANFSKGVYADLERKDPANEEVKLEAAYHAIAPELQPGGTYNWDKFYADRDKALADLKAAGYSATADALQTARDRFTDPTINKLDAQYQAARKVQQQIFNIPKYVTASGEAVSTKDSKAIDDFGSKISDQRAKWIRQYDLPNLDNDTTAKALANEMGDPALYDWYKALNKDYNAHINSAYKTFLSKNRDILDPFFHYYYDSISELRRWGIEEEAPSTGFQKPKRPERPTALSYSERQKAKLAETELGIIEGR